MAERNEKPQEIVSVGGDAPPDWLVGYTEDDKSLDQLSEYRVISRIKVIQGSSKKSLRDTFGEGTAIVTPTKEIICKSDESFLFVPLLFFVEYTKESDIKDKISPWIIERSFDRGCEIAAKSLDPDRRTEEYGEGFICRHVENLNFAGFIYGDHQLAGRLVVMNFSKGERTYGSTFVSSITLRKSPLWSQVWRFTPAYREAEFGWWGLDVDNPEKQLYIKQDEGASFLSFHEELRSDYAKQRLVVDRSDGLEDPATADADAEEGASVGSDTSMM